MFRETQDHQMSLNDRYLTAGSQTRSAVEKYRAWLVGQVIYPNVDESRFAALFRNCNETNTSRFVRTNDVIPIAKGLASFKTNGIHFLVANLTFQFVMVFINLADYLETFVCRC